LAILATPKTPEAPTDEHHAKALSFIDSLPSNDIVSKTGLLTIGATAATWLVSKEIYVINEESLVLASFAFVISYIYKTIREPYSEWADARLKVLLFILHTN
jgi:F-type H+-transporting ATPase subunit b